jgi:Ni,Fe-hydrogenase I small subunit
MAGWRDGQSNVPTTRRMNRREFLKCCGALTAPLALPRRYAGRIATALSNAPRLPLFWLEFEDRKGHSRSFLRAIHSFDPCMACSVHLIKPSSRLDQSSL